MLPLKCFNNTDPTSVVWAAQFYALLTSQYWRRNGMPTTDFGRIPHAEDVFNPLVYVFGSKDVAKARSRNT